jgi:hypothetical protein
MRLIVFLIDQIVLLLPIFSFLFEDKLLKDQSIANLRAMKLLAIKENMGFQIALFLLIKF